MTEVNEKLRQAIVDDQPIRYFLLYSSIFDTHPFIYHGKIYKQAIKQAGGKNAREAKQFGWSNMPKVVTWTGDSNINAKIKQALLCLPPYKDTSMGSPIIRPVNW